MALGGLLVIVRCVDDIMVRTKNGKKKKKKKKPKQNKTKTMSIYSRENLALQLILQLCYNCNVTECEMMDPCISDR